MQALDGKVGEALGQQAAAVAQELETLRGKAWRILLVTSF
jgi:hypothetical protein